MRCQACNDPLSDREATRKSPSGMYYELCNHCFETIADQVQTTENPLADDLVTEYEKNEEGKGL